MLPLLIFLVLSWAQIIEPVRSLHVHSDQLFASANENALLNRAFPGTDELDLFQRGLEDQKGNKGRNADADQIPAVDPKKAILSIGQIQPAMLKPISATLTKLINTFGESLVSELFSHIRYLIRNPSLIKQYTRNGLPASDAFKNNFSREALLAAVGELSNEDVEKGMPLLQTLKKNFRNTEMEALVINIMKLLENQPTLQKYAELSGNLDKAFGLDKPLDIAGLGLPVPTKENPVVYFQLVDDDYPSIKFLVKVKLEDDQFVESILIKMNESMSSQNSYIASNDENSLEELYKKLPLSKLVKVN